METALTDLIGDRTPRFRPTTPASPRAWGPGVSKAQVMVGLPMTGFGADLSLAGGKRLFEGAPESAGSVGRTKMEHLAGMPLQGYGADISSAGGKRHNGNPVGYTPRTKMERLAGMPMKGQGADIALAGGRRMFERTESAACLRARSEPAPRETGGPSFPVQELHLRDVMGLCGREKAPRRVTWREDGSRSPRTSRVEGDESMSPRRSKSGSRSPRKGARRSASAGVSGAVVRQRSVPARLDEITSDLMTRLNSDEKDLVCSPSLGADMVRSSTTDESTLKVEEIVSEHTMSTSSLGGSERAGKQSLDTMLKMSVNAARALASVAQNAPSDSKMKDQLEAVFKDKMDIAWAAMCMKLDLPLNPQETAMMAGSSSPRKSKKAAAGMMKTKTAQSTASSPVVESLYEEAMRIVQAAEKDKSGDAMSTPSTMLPTTTPGSTLWDGQSPFCMSGKWDLDSAYSPMHGQTIGEFPSMMSNMPSAASPASAARIMVSQASTASARRVVVVPSGSSPAGAPPPTVSNAVAGGSSNSNSNVQRMASFHSMPASTPTGSLAPTPAVVVRNLPTVNNMGLPVGKSGGSNIVVQTHANGEAGGSSNVRMLSVATSAAGSNNGIAQFNIPPVLRQVSAISATGGPNWQVSGSQTPRVVVTARPTVAATQQGMQQNAQKTVGGSLPGVPGLPNPSTSAANAAAATLAAAAPPPLPTTRRPGTTIMGL
mmetsp:Transcript_23145/g.49315  ORF Transcript_23145/g.49315 Transcript_23145/m.49315 type:complete len:714 (-) Transcript_23145:398-2539(-)